MSRRHREPVRYSQDIPVPGNTGRHQREKQPLTSINDTQRVDAHPNGGKNTYTMYDVLRPTLSSSVVNNGSSYGRIVQQIDPNARRFVGLGSQFNGLPNQLNGSFNVGYFGGGNNNSCCNRDLGGNDCGRCSFCRSRLVSAQLDHGIRDAWCEIYRSMSNNLAHAEHGIDYLATTGSFTAANVVPNVSQIFIYVPASGLDGFDTITVTRLASSAEFPLPADLPPRGLMFMVPQGTTIGPNVPRPSFLAITGITQAKLSGISTSYGSPPVNPPAAALNGMWQLGATSTSSQTYVKMSTAMYDTRWSVQISNLNRIDAVTPPTPGMPAVYKVANVIGYDNSWVLSTTTVREFIAIKRVYIKSFTLCEKNDRCGACHASRGMGCMGTRCNQVKASFRMDFGANFQSNVKHGEISLQNEQPECVLLTRIINGKRNFKTGLCIDEESGRIVPLKKNSKDLVKCSKSELRRALRVVKEMDDEIESHPEDVVDTYGILQFQPHRAMDFGGANAGAIFARNEACLNNIKQILDLHKAQLSAETRAQNTNTVSSEQQPKPNPVRDPNGHFVQIPVAHEKTPTQVTQQKTPLVRSTREKPTTKPLSLAEHNRANSNTRVRGRLTQDKILRKTVFDAKEKGSVWDGDLFGKKEDN